ncbi:hypothetical protein [Salinicoccus albus]|uniref:hypothetical protein n=1 Tax=Salinicoccus albus TaxID=418756 RepID=UPI0003715587|nr:hypothetical protein [Salinicoccus albus]
MNNELKKKVKIATILSETEVIINAGKLDGIQQGQAFYIVDIHGRVIKDPDTDEILGSFPGYKGKVVVKKVKDKFSYCESPTYYRNYAAELTLASTKSLIDNMDIIGGQEQNKLNILKEDITDLSSKFTDSPVKIGDILELIEY